MRLTVRWNALDNAIELILGNSDENVELLTREVPKRKKLRKRWLESMCSDVESWLTFYSGRLRPQRVHHNALHIECIAPIFYHYKA